MNQLALENQVCFPLYNASNRMIRAYRPHLKELDLTYPQYLTMLVLWEFEELTVSAIGTKLGLDSGTLTPLLKRLELKSLLRRERSKHDERVVNIIISDKGKALRSSAEHIPLTVAKSLGLSAKDLAELKALCSKLTGHI